MNSTLCGRNKLPHHTALHQKYSVPVELLSFSLIRPDPVKVKSAQLDFSASFCDFRFDFSFSCSRKSSFSLFGGFLNIGALQWCKIWKLNGLRTPTLISWSHYNLWIYSPLQIEHNSNHLFQTVSFYIRALRNVYIDLIPYS